MRIDQDLQQRLLSLSFVSDGFHLQKIDGGTINNNYYLETAGNKYLVKYFVGEEFVLLTRNETFSLQLKLAKSGLAPEPVYISDDGLLYIEKWLDIQTLRDNSFDPKVHLPMLASALSRVHAIKADVDELPLLAQWQRYLSRISSNRGQWQERIDKISPLWMRAKRDCFCHHDLTFEHVCTAPQGILLDWEYAAISNRYFDIASAALANELTTRQLVKLCRCYADCCQLNGRQVTRDVVHMLPLAQLTSDLWYAAAKG